MRLILLQSEGRESEERADDVGGGPGSIQQPPAHFFLDGIVAGFGVQSGEMVGGLDDSLLECLEAMGESELDLAEAAAVGSDVFEEDGGGVEDGDEGVFDEAVFGDQGELVEAGEVTRGPGA